MSSTSLFNLALIPSIVLHLGIMAVMPGVAVQKPKPVPETRVELSLEEIPIPEEEEPPPPPPPPPPAPVPQPPEPEPEPEPEEEEAPEEPPQETIEIPPPPKPVEGPPQIASAGALGGVIGGVEGGVMGGKVPPPPPPLPPKPKPKPPERIQVGASVQESKLLVRIPPQYPPQAKKLRIQGTVKMQVRIAKNGQVTQIEVSDGHPMLVAAAKDAVQKWRYKPTMLAGRPVEVDTIVHVRFGLR